MAEEQLYGLRLRSENGYPPRLMTNSGVHWTEAGIIAELETVRNFKGNVVHMDVFPAGEEEALTRAPDWLRERGIPTSYTEYLKANPAAHKRAIFVEARRVLHHQRIDLRMRVDKMRREYKPYLRVNPKPPVEGRIVAAECQLAWLTQEIETLTKEIDGE